MTPSQPLGWAAPVWSAPPPTADLTTVGRHWVQKDFAASLTFSFSRRLNSSTHCFVSMLAELVSRSAP